MALGFDPSDEAKALFAQLQKRWNALYAWDLKAKLPWQKVSWEDWEAYQKAWLTEATEYTPPDLGEAQAVLPALSPHADTLNAVERDAKDHGYGAVEPPLTGIDVTQTSNETKAANAVDDAARAAEQAAKNAAATAKEFPWTTVGIVAACSLVAVGVIGVLFAKQTPYVVPLVLSEPLRRKDQP